MGGFALIFCTFFWRVICETILSFFMITEAFGTANNYLRLSQTESEEEGGRNSEKNGKEIENEKLDKKHLDDDEEHKSDLKSDHPSDVNHDWEVGIK